MSNGRTIRNAAVDYAIPKDSADVKVSEGNVFHNCGKLYV